MHQFYVRKFVYDKKKRIGVNFKEIKTGDTVTLDYMVEGGKVRIKRDVYIVAQDDTHIYVNTGYLRNIHIDKKSIMNAVIK